MYLLGIVIIYIAGLLSIIFGNSGAHAILSLLAFIALKLNDK